ncbi:hypothetical protein [Chryseobacterium sp. SC28]|uniref:hypothetical protein n=1 Tax=Chryseobacterium sp. SC28 TaxID=2268028 RepID=UPI000F654717|nr:hypothetical protein [Chryseobacterium sp. SC28]RRQ46651.1 hypothetical protein DTW91_04015 [Chryseobacterium sp. SC28]
MEKKKEVPSGRLIPSIGIYSYGKKEGSPVGTIDMEKKKEVPSGRLIPSIGIYFIPMEKK